MKVIILAAGEGKRLQPLTNNLPKCMVELNGKPILYHQIECLRRNGIIDINVCVGYARNKINCDSVKYYYNPEFSKTNMVYTLFCAKELLNSDDDILISYGDIVYNDKVLNTIVNDKSKIGVVVDRNWFDYWSERMENPLDDAETLKIDEQGYIYELGKKPTSYDEIEGQYMGLLKLTGHGVSIFKKVFHDAIKQGEILGKPVENAYMTDFLQHIIEQNYLVQSVPVASDWVEIDTINDLELEVTSQRLMRIQA